MRADGSHVRNLTQTLAQDGEPSWSPDGTRIAFVSARDGNVQVFVMNADGGNVRRVSHDSWSDMASVWSPDGSRIAFMCTTPTPRLVTEICAVGADGNGERRLTSPSMPGDNLYPVWRPDSKAVFFTRPRGVGEATLAGGLVRPAIGGDVAELAYAPNGGTFAYLRRASSKWVLYVGRRKISSVPGDVDTPVWSPDGSRIAFVSIGPRSDLYVVGRDGSGQRRLTSGPGNSLSPRWSPDGKWIAFERLRGNSSQVYVVRADGTGERE